MGGRLRAPGLAGRHVAMLRAVEAGRAELTWSRVPDLIVDGRCCCDHAASATLVAFGLVTAAVPGAVGAQVPARLTPAGAAVLARQAGRAGMSLATSTSRPGGVCLWGRRRAGSPTTCENEAEGPSMRPTNLDCLALGCDWVWWPETCARGCRHTVRLCVRCLTGDDPEPCPADDETQAAEVAAA